MTAPIVLDPLLPPDEAATVVDVWHRFPGYGLYSNEGFATEFAPELAQRYDATVNFIRTGGRFGRSGEDVSMLAARTNYFRETYAYGDAVSAPGIERFFHHPRLLDGARALHDRDVVVPAIVYANILLPGQELAVHTDVPEFRGANRKLLPQWLLVVMHHSGLFEEYRMPIATAISWFHDCDGGELAYWPAGAQDDVQRHRVRFNTAMVLDTDSVFHGVDRVAEVSVDDLPPIRPGTVLEFSGARQWSLRAATGSVLTTYRWEQLRFSVSWKAYCFRDEHERDTWRAHRDDLTATVILDRLVEDLCERGLAQRNIARDGALGQLLIDQYIRLPVSTPFSTS